MPTNNTPTTAAPQVLSFGNGETFSNTGQAMNGAAQGALNNLGIQGNTYTGYVAPTPTAPTATVPVATADMAKTDLSVKQTNLNNIQQGMAQQSVTNGQNQAVTDANAQNKAATDAAGKPSQTLNEIKNLVGGAQDVTSTDPNKSDTTRSLEDINKQQDQAYAEYKGQIDQLRAGTFPLTPDQQAQIDYVQKQFDILKQQQKTANINYEGGIKQLGIVSGRQRYAPEIQVGLAQQAITNGIAKIAELESKAANSIAELRTAFQDKNYAMIDSAYKNLNSYLDQKSKTINDIAANVREEAKLALDKHNTEMADQKYEDEKQQAAIKFATDNNVSKPFYLVGNTAVDTATGEKVDLAEYQRRTGQKVGTPESETNFDFIQTDITTPAEATLALQERQQAQNEYEFDANQSYNYDKLAQDQAQFEANYSLDERKTIAAESAAGNIKDSIVKVNGSDYIVGADGTLQNPQIPEATKQAAELKQSALKTAQDILNNKLDGAPLGAKRYLQLQHVGGSASKDFDIAYNNLKALLSLDNVKLLKGQGQVSDAERQLLQDASSKLDVNSSPEAFKQALNDIIKGLSGAAEAPASSGGNIIEYNGKQYQTDANGDFDPDSPLTKAGSGAANAQKPTALVTNSKSLASVKIGSAKPSPIVLASAIRYPSGSIGGQCTTFLHNLADFDHIGDGLSSKRSYVKNNGILAAVWKQSPRVGDIIVTNDNPTYGHTAMVNAILPGGKVQLTESNFSGKDKVSYSRIVSITDPRIYGAIRPRSLTLNNIRTA